MNISLCTDTNWLFSEDAYSIYAPCMYQPTYEKYKTQIENYVENPSVQIFVYVMFHKKVGILVLDSSKPVAEIVGIAVAEDYRRRGIGKNLVLGVMDLAHLDRLAAQTDNESIAFYRKCGFSEKKIVKEYPDGKKIRYNCSLRLEKDKSGIFGCKNVMAW